MGGKAGIVADGRRGAAAGAQAAVDAVLADPAAYQRALGTKGHQGACRAEAAAPEAGPPAAAGQNEQHQQQGDPLQVKARQGQLEIEQTGEIEPVGQGGHQLEQPVGQQLQGGQNGQGHKACYQRDGGHQKGQ